MGKPRRILELCELPPNENGSPVVSRDISATLGYADGTDATFNSHEGDGEGVTIKGCCNPGDCNPAVEECNL